MSRADELKTFAVIGASKSGERPGEFFPCLDIVSQACDAESAAAIIRDLEATVASGDARIAELEAALTDAVRQRDSARAEVTRVRGLIDRDRTGLARGLSDVRLALKAYSWLADDEQWGSYQWEERTEATLRREVQSCFAELEEIALGALRASGAAANSAFHPENPSQPRLPIDDDRAKLAGRVSRADELVRVAADAAGIYVRAGGPLVSTEHAAKIIRDLEATIAARDARIAEVERRRLPPIGAVVSWCPQCGPEPQCDEDGCCLQCGSTVGDVPDWRARDARIAELKCLVDEQHDYLVQAVDQARAEVPEWCQEVVRQLYVWTSSCPPEHEADYLLGKVCLDLTTDQLRACGIDPMVRTAERKLDSVAEQAALLGTTAQTAIAVVLLCAIGLVLCWRLDQ